MRNPILGMASHDLCSVKTTTLGAIPGIDGNPHERFFTLPPLQKNCEYFFFVFTWEYCIEKWRGFLVIFFLVSVSHETKHENSSKNSGKIRREIRGKIRDKNSENSGNFRSATFSDLKIFI